jgi:hypothetical protein
VLAKIDAWLRQDQFSAALSGDLDRRLDAALDVEGSGGPTSDEGRIADAVYDVGMAATYELFFRAERARVKISLMAGVANPSGDPLGVLDGFLRERRELIADYAAWIDSLAKAGCDGGADLARAWAYLAFAYLPEDPLVGGLSPDADGTPAPDTEAYWTAYSAFDVDRKPLWGPNRGTWWNGLHRAVIVEIRGLEATQPQRARVMAAIKDRLAAEPSLAVTVGPLPQYPRAAGGAGARSFGDLFDSPEPTHVATPL